MYNLVRLKKQMKLIEIITYFDLFNYPLKKEEILGFAEIQENEWADQNIENKNGFYYLKNREEILEIRKKREKHAAKLWKKTYFYLRILKCVPFLKMVAVCNTLAFNHPEKDSDIDLFIVTAKNRLWTTRVLVTFLLQILGVRRHGKKVSARFCLSFWCTEEAINLENIQIKPQDPYLAFWCLTLKPVLDDKLYNNFIQKNKQWIKVNYKLELRIPLEGDTGGVSTPKFKKKSCLSKSQNTPQPTQGGFKKLYHSNLIAKLLEKILNGKLGNYIENKLSNKLKPRAEQKAKLAGSDSSIIISEQMLKFHNHDKRKEIYSQWQKKLNLLK